MSCCNNNKKTPFTEHSLINAGASVIKHFTDPTYNAFVNDEVQQERLKICGSCEELESFISMKRCKVCLCFLDAKTKLVDQDCPHPNGSKWQKE